ncbi:GT-D fold domain-containing glycosyltransferase [Pediococcus parvulus]|uniref:GT-D fold domain-containing glycosyltransferase n=1 Tax=Pediococcus parvulus TaxID=54062 RepID=UPI003D00FC47
MKTFLLSVFRNLKHIDINIKYLLIQKIIKKNAPQVINEVTTVKKIQRDKLSVSRFGDGEFRWMAGIRNDSFQDNNVVMAERLRKVLNSEQPNHMVCIPDVFRSQSKYTTDNKLAWRRLLIDNSKKWLNVMNKNKIFYDANFTRPYIDRKNKAGAKNRFEELKKIWENKNVLIIEGTKTKFGVNNNLLLKAKKIGRILCPAVNAFEKYDEILEKSKKHLKSFDIVLLALGPTATILAYDLNNLGVQAVDIGHVDIEYEWYLMGVTKRVPLKHKYVNEVKNGGSVDEELTDNSNYNKQILEIIRN